MSDIDKGLVIFEEWIKARFPETTVHYVGHKDWDFYRFVIETEGRLHLGATAHALEDARILRGGLIDLDRLGYLTNLDSEMWLLLTAVGVAVKDPTSW